MSLSGTGSFFGGWVGGSKDKDKEKEKDRDNHSGHVNGKEREKLLKESTHGHPQRPPSTGPPPSKAATGIIGVNGFMASF